MRPLDHPGVPADPERQAAAVKPERQLHVLTAPADERFVETARFPEVTGAHRAVAAEEKVPRDRTVAEVEPAANEMLVAHVDEAGVIAEPRDHLRGPQGPDEIGGGLQGLVKRMVAVDVAHDTGRNLVVTVLGEMTAQEAWSSQGTGVEEAQHRRGRQSRAFVPGGRQAISQILLEMIFQLKPAGE